MLMAAFWVQQGYGKSDKITRLYDAGLLGGVLLSPADEEPPALQATRDSTPDVEVLLDPQTYVYSIPGGTARCHEAHGLGTPNLNWGMPASEVEDVVRAVIAANDRLGVTDLIAPTCVQRSLNDVWTSLALQMARTTIGVVDGQRRVFVSAVIEESALANWGDVANWLDVATSLDADGFYVIVDRVTQGSYPAMWNPSHLTNLLRLIYSLSQLNEYEVLAGYSDVEGILQVAAGASGSATGWFYSLRAFSDSKWQPSSGGRQAIPRAFSVGLLTPLLAVGEVEQVARSELAVDAYPDEAVRTALSSNPEGWSLVDASNHHLSSLAMVVNDVARQNPIAARLDSVEARLADARGRLATLEQQGVPFSGAYGQRLDAFRRALDGFRALESI
jgi:hypothetical protein